MTTTYTETQQPLFVTRMRRLSKSGFLCESNSKSPRLDKMIAHISLFDRTTKCLEDGMIEQSVVPLPPKRIRDKPAVPPRPILGTRSLEYVHTNPEETEETPAWITELTCRPARQECVYVTEVEQIEDVDGDDIDWGHHI